MTQGVDPNDIFHNGVWYNRSGGGGVVTAEVDPITGVIVFSAGDLVLMYTTIADARERARARNKNPRVADQIYGRLTHNIGTFGRDAPAGGIYYDSEYDGSNGVSDGSIDRPYTTLMAANITQAGAVLNLKRGSKFFATSELALMMAISADDVVMRPYGTSGDYPAIFGAKQYIEFSASGSEYRKEFAMSLSHTHYFVSFIDDPYTPLRAGSGVGSLASGEYYISGGYIYVKDNPLNRGGTVLVSVCGTVLQVTGHRCKLDQIMIGGGTESSVLVSAVDSTVLTGFVARDTQTFGSGINGIQLGRNTNGATGSTIIRHIDIGSRDNGIYSDGEDSDTEIIEPVCIGLKRVASDTYGYQNDGVTAHGTGLGKWTVVGGKISNCKEDGIDLAGDNSGGGGRHYNSVTAYNTISNTGESGIYAWGYNPLVFSNYISDTGWSGVQIGQTTAVAQQYGGLVFNNYIVGCGKSANTCGVGLGWLGIKVHNNTFVRTSASSRAALSPSATVTSASVKRNLFVLETDTPIITTTTSNATTIKGIGFEDNQYVIPSGNVTLPFDTGGSDRTFAQWLTDVERTAKSYATLSAALLSSTHRPSNNCK